jgi:hypothetical protein
MELTPEGTVMELRLLQLAKALAPMLEIEEEIATLLSELQPLNVLAGMEPTDAWSVADESLLQPLNTPVPIDVTLPGTLTLESPVQFAKALFPILFTEEGMDIAVMADFPEKAPAPIAVAVLGICTLPPLPV